MSIRTAKTSVCREVLIAGFAALLFLTGCQTVDHSARSALRNCVPTANTQPLCGFTNPEDMAALPGQLAIIVSEYGRLGGSRPGQLVALVPGNYPPGTHRREVLFDGGSAATNDENWGSPTCLEPPGKEFSPHGIDLVERADGKLQLSVVQHGGRESIELFEVRGKGEQWALTWRGCIIAPEDALLNSVAADTQGTLYTTKAISRTTSLEEVRVVPDMPTGAVYRWSSSTGFEIVKGSEGILPNGLVTTPDGETLYVVYSGEPELRKIDAASGEIIGTVAVGLSDNIKWSADGKSLTVATFPATEKPLPQAIAQCADSIDKGYCPIDVVIVEVEPDTLASRELYRGDGNTAMGAGTVGLKLGRHLYIGSFMANRILQVDL